jgi:hypothetical protein
VPISTTATRTGWHAKRCPPATIFPLHAALLR